MGQNNRQRKCTRSTEHVVYRNPVNYRTRQNNLRITGLLVDSIENFNGTEPITHRGVTLAVGTGIIWETIKDPESMTIKELLASRLKNPDIELVLG